MRMPRTVALSAMMRTRRAKAREVGTFGGELAGEMEIGFNCIFYSEGFEGLGRMGLKRESLTHVEELLTESHQAVSVICCGGAHAEDACNE